MRSFHPASLLASLALLLPACSPAPTRVAHADPPQAGASVAAAADWHARDLVELQAAMAAGEVDAATLTAHFLARIAAIDDAGPRLNAVIELNPDADAIAARLDRERSAGTVRGPLHGIPVLLKDNIDTDDGMATSAGSLALVDHRPGRDATLVARLREEGAVILGKTNLSEWANFRSSHSTSGWSARGGQTRNPFVLDRSPCGSSSGSAVAVAAGLAPLAVGTETDGSIVCPAAVNGVVGIKPSLGLVSRHGIIPIAASQDTAGPIARSVADARVLLRAMQGADPADPVTARVPRDLWQRPPTGLAGARIGVLRPASNMHPGQRRVLEAAVQRLRAAGAEVVDPLALPTAGQFGDAEFTVLLYEFKDGLERYLRDTDAPVPTLDALIAFNDAHAGEEQPWFGQDVFRDAAAKGGLDEPAYAQAREKARRLAGAEGIDALLQTHRLDALVAITTGPAWSIDPVHGDHYPGGSSSAAAVAGYPNVTVPAGQVHGLPVGVSFIAGAFDDARVIGLAESFEATGPGFVAPTMLPTVPLEAGAAAIR